MSDVVLQTRALSKERRSRHGRVPVVRDLDLVVRRGEVHGLLGPDGAGKTTILRMLLGLARPTRGQVEVLGRPVPRELPAVIDRVGAVVGRPRFSSRLSGRHQLLQLARSVGRDERDVDRALATAGLTAGAGDHVAAYGGGMRHQLALAAALLTSPEVLVLDEPTGGLHGSGARGLRDTVRELGESGVTVLLASHVLAEVQQVCDTVSVLARGRLVSSGPVEDLVGRDRPTGVWLLTTDRDAALRHLGAAGLRATLLGTHLYVEGARDPAYVTEVLARHEVYVRELVPDRPDLDAMVDRLSDQRDEEES